MSKLKLIIEEINNESRRLEVSENCIEKSEFFKAKIGSNVGNNELIRVEFLLPYDIYCQFIEKKDFNINSEDVNYALISELDMISSLDKFRIELFEMLIMKWQNSFLIKSKSDDDIKLKIAVLIIQIFNKHQNGLNTIIKCVMNILCDNADKIDVGLYHIVKSELPIGILFKVISNLHLYDELNKLHINTIRDYIQEHKSWFLNIMNLKDYNLLSKVLCASNFTIEKITSIYPTKISYRQNVSSVITFDRNVDSYPYEVKNHDQNLNHFD